MANDREACGRCSTSVAVGVANRDRDAEDRAERDPYGEERIEVNETTIRLLSPDGWMSRLSSRLDDVAQRLVWRQQ